MKFSLADCPIHRKKFKKQRESNGKREKKHQARKPKKQSKKSDCEAEKGRANNKTKSVLCRETPTKAFDGKRGQYLVKRGLKVANRPLATISIKYSIALAPF